MRCAKTKNLKTILLLQGRDRLYMAGLGAPVGAAAGGIQGHTGGPGERIKRFFLKKVGR